MDMPGCPSNFRFYAGNGKWSVWTGASATHSRTSTLSAQTTIASYMWEKWVVSVENPNGHCTSSMADWCVASHFPTIIRYCWHPRLHGQVSNHLKWPLGTAANLREDTTLELDRRTPRLLWGGHINVWPSKKGEATNKEIMSTMLRMHGESWVLLVPIVTGW